MEYGSDVLEIHTDAVEEGSQVLLIDDVLATGGTICAAIDLIHRSGGKVVHVLALIEIADLPGRENIESKFPNIDITTLTVT